MPIDSVGIPIRRYGIGQTAARVAVGSQGPWPRPPLIREGLWDDLPRASRVMEPYVPQRRRGPAPRRAIARPTPRLAPVTRATLASTQPSSRNSLARPRLARGRRSGSSYIEPARGQRCLPAHVRSRPRDTNPLPLRPVSDLTPRVAASSLRVVVGRQAGVNGGDRAVDQHQGDKDATSPAPHQRRSVRHSLRSVGHKILSGFK
jgi:hypothetical protein